MMSLLESTITKCISTRKTDVPNHRPFPSSQSTCSLLPSRNRKGSRVVFSHCHSCWQVHAICRAYQSGGRRSGVLKGKYFSWEMAPPDRDSAFTTASRFGLISHLKTLLY